MKGRILVAADGGAGSLGALRAARALAERDGVCVDVLAVDEAAPGYGGGAAYGLAPPFSLDASRVRELREAVRRQLGMVGGVAAEWPVEVRTGAVAPVIALEAEARGAALVVLGRSRRTGGAIASAVAGLARVPVLAASAEGALPTCAVVAVGLRGPASDAARAAQELLPRNGVLHLVHVARRSGTDARAALEVLRLELRSTGSVKVRAHVLQGDPLEEVLALAARKEAGLVAVGCHRDRPGALAAGLPTWLVRRAGCAVLVAPRSTPGFELETEDIEEQLHLATSAFG
ncbi:MAG TPA: universal stress protein [Longimicrobiaceae bacterium]